VETTQSNQSLQRYPDPAAVAQAAADIVVPFIESAGDRPFSLALSGGTTPQRFYRLLAEEPYRSRIPWRNVHVFLVDERHVPHDHPDSNYRMIREAMLDHVPIPASNIHPMPTEDSPDDCATRYESELNEFFGNATPQFDVMILGMGPDGHTASLFPGRELATNMLVSAVYDSPKPPPTRLTLTLPVINQSRSVMFLATGTDKADALSKIFLEGTQSGLPAAMVRPTEGTLLWLADHAAVRDIAG
jgi:6-phosphogluconolactonase